MTATSAGAATYDDETNPTAICLNGNGHNSAYVNLGTGIVPAEGGPITIEIWATQHSEKNWSRIFDFGPDNQNYLLMSWTQGTGLTTDAVEIKSANTTLLRADNQMQPYSLYVPYHISLTLVQNGDGKATLSWAKRDAATGALLKSGSGTTSAAWDIASIASWTYCCIGRSQYDADSDAKASYDEVRIWKTALTEEQLTWSAKLGPDMLPTADASANSTMTLTCDNGAVSVNGETAVAGGSVSVPRSPDATLTAVPAAGYVFVRWTGDTDRIVAGNDRSAEITVNSARDFALAAEFESADHVVYARYENGDFVYLTPNKVVGNAPQGGMNDGITILFSSDAEYRQLAAVPDEVAKSAGLELGGKVKLTGAADWTALDYSFAGYSVDLNGKTLTTRSLDGGGDQPMVNTNFEADGIADGDWVAMTPTGWSISGTVRLVKNNRSYADTQYGKSTWCYVPNGAYIQQQIKVRRPGTYTFKFKAACKNDHSYSASNGYAQLDGVTQWSQNSIGYVEGEKSFRVSLDAGVHTLKLGCNGGTAVLYDDVSVSLADTPSYIVNGDFQADTIADGAQVAMTPRGWERGEKAYMMKNHTGNGYSNRDGSNWLYLENGGYAQQQFTAEVGGTCTLSFKVASRDAASSWKNSSCYVQIDGNNVHNAYTGSWNASTKTYTVQVNAGTHTLKVGCNGGGAVLVDNVSLKCPIGFVVDVPEGNTLVNDSVFITGTGLKLKKTGAGTLVANKANQSYAGGTEVSEGTFKLGSNSALGAASDVTVNPDGILDVNGVGDIYNYSYVLNGGTIQNTGTDAGEGLAQIAKLRLTADSTFKPTCSYGLIGSGYAATTLDLAGHTLTVPIGTGKKFYLFNTTVTAGTLDISGDGWLVADKTAVNASAADLVANCALDIRVPFSLRNYEALYATDSNAGVQPFTVNGVFKPHSSYYHGVTLANNATLDLTACEGTLATPGLFTSGANALVLQAAEVVTPLQSIESSGTQWIDTGYVPNENTVIEASFNTMSKTTDWGVFFGACNTDSPNNGILFRYLTATTMNAWFGCPETSSPEVSDLVGKDITVELKSGKVTIDGTEYAINTTASLCQRSIYIFGGNKGDESGNIWRRQAMRLYWMKISENGVLKRDFMPGRNRDGVLGLWDKVEKKFYANKGTGTFTATEIAEETPEPIVLPTTLSVELHGRNLNTSKILGWSAIPDDVIFVPSEATRNDHLTFDIRADGLYVPRNTVIYFR